MRIGDLVKNLGIDAKPSARDGEELGSVPQALSQAGYTVEGMRELLGLQDLPVIPYARIPGYAWRCHKEDSPRAWMALLFLMYHSVPRHRVEQVLGSVAVEAMLRRRLLTQEGDEVESRVDVYPCEGAWVFTDRRFTAMHQGEHVYELGLDSYRLARATPRRPVERALDLCTGSGVHAILAARHSGQCDAVDIYRRPLAFAGLNATMNGVRSQCEYHHGDLYGPVAGRTYGLVTANPPFVPDPGDSQMHRHRTGGDDGEEITRQIVAGLPSMLEVSGTLALTTNYPIIRGNPYLDRLASWLPSTTGWGIAVLDFEDVPLEDFLFWHLPAKGHRELDRLEFTRWMQRYDERGIESMRLGNLYIRRLPEGQPGWTAYKQIPTPRSQMAAFVDDWLDGLTRFHRADFTDAPAARAKEWTPALNPLVRRVWTSTADGCVRFTEDAWSDGAIVEAEEAWVASQVDGTRTITALADLLAARSGLDTDSARNRTSDHLRTLGIKQVVR